MKMFPPTPQDNTNTGNNNRHGSCYTPDQTQTVCFMKTSTLHLAHSSFQTFTAQDWGVITWHLTQSTQHNYCSLSANHLFRAKILSVSQCYCQVLCLLMCHLMVHSWLVTNASAILWRHWAWCWRQQLSKKPSLLQYFTHLNTGKPKCNTTKRLGQWTQFLLTTILISTYDSTSSNDSHNYDPSPCNHFLNKPDMV